jgi:hypothetical protein
MEVFRTEMSDYCGRPLAFKLSGACGLLAAVIGLAGGVHAATCDELVRLAGSMAV